MKKRKAVSITTLIIAIFFIVLLPVNILLIFSTHSYINAVRAQTLSSCQSILDFYSNQLDNEIYQISKFFYEQESGNAQFIALLAAEGNDAQVLAIHNLYRDFQSSLFLNYLSDAYFIFSKKQDKNIFVYTESQDFQNVETYLIENRGSVAFEPVKQWKMLTIEGQRYLIKSYSQGEWYYGGMIALDPFLKEMKENFNFPYKNVEIVGTDDQTAINSEDVKSEKLVVNSYVERGDLRISVTLDANQIYMNLPLSKRLSYAFSFVCLLLIPILYILTHRTLLRPLKRIDMALGKLESGQQDYRIGEHHKYAREFLRINHSFNQMADQIQNLKIESYEKEMEKKRMELQNIQLQVHPHSLLNIFHMIFSMAQVKNFKGVQKMAVYLSQYFRYLFYPGDLRTVDMEMDLVRNYLEVVALQYIDCFEVEYSIDEMCLKEKVPSLMIHGFVENIAKHVIMPDSFIQIRICAIHEDKGIRIKISDDGIGIHQEILDQINRGNPVEKADGMHIGISNAMYRLKLLCGDQGYIHVSSVISEGTCVEIFVPKGVNEDECSDCRR